MKEKPIPVQVPQGAQEYLEAIFEMEEEGGRIAQARIAKRLGVSAPAVSEQVRRLSKEGLVSVADREITLSAEGREVATPLVRRHRLAERLLVDILEIPWHRAHEEAHSWEHVISPEVEERPVLCRAAEALVSRGGGSFLGDVQPDPAVSGAAFSPGVEDVNGGSPTLHRLNANVARAIRHQNGTRRFGK